MMYLFSKQQLGEWGLCEPEQQIPKEKPGMSIGRRPLSSLRLLASDGPKARIDSQSTLQLANDEQIRSRRTTSIKLLYRPR